MHGEQQSWHDWDPSKYETKRQPKGQTVDRLQNWSVREEQNKKKYFNSRRRRRRRGGGGEVFILRTIKNRGRKGKKKKKREKLIFLCFSELSFVSPSGDSPPLSALLVQGRAQEADWDFELLYDSIRYTWRTISPWLEAAIRHWDKQKLQCPQSKTDTKLPFSSQLLFDSLSRNHRSQRNNRAQEPSLTEQ